MNAHAILNMTGVVNRVVTMPQHDAMGRPDQPKVLWGSDWAVAKTQAPGPPDLLTHGSVRLDISRTFRSPPHDWSILSIHAAALGPEIVSGIASVEESIYETNFW